MANQYGFSLGEVYKDIEGIKGARQVNELNRLKLDEERQKPMRNALLAEKRREASTGDVSAQKELLALDPENGPKFIDALGKMGELERDQAKRNVDELGKIAFYVQQGGTPQEREQRYMQVLQSAEPPLRDRMPQQYDPRDMELLLMKATAMDKLLENPQSVRVGEQDIVYKSGRELERGTRAPTGSSNTRQFKATDESLVYKMMVELEGGILDQNGNVSGLTNDAQYRAQSRAAEAMKLLQSRPELSLNEAVAIVAKDTGLPLPDSRQMNAVSNPNDRASIRDYLLPPQ